MALKGLPWLREREVVVQSVSKVRNEVGLYILDVWCTRLM